MGDVINLNKWKKKKAREEKEKRAQENRLRNGVSSAERRLGDKKKQLADKQLDGHKLESEARGTNNDEG
jgi:hypothetical protein